MITFDKCAYCTQTPRVRFCSTSSGEETKNRDALTSQLEDLKIQVTVNDHYYRCNDCGTYYRFESDFSGTVGYYDLRIVRITIIEALLAFRSDHQTCGDFIKAAREARASRLGSIKVNRALLKSPYGCAREFGAETLADIYKKQGKNEKVRELLQDADSDTRLGALWSYAEVPWRSYMFDSPKLNIYQGLFYFKPFGKLSSVLKTVITLLCDPDKRIRILARNFIDRFFHGNSFKLSAKLHRLPRDKWSAELKELLINNNYPGKDEQSFIELCNFMIDPEEETRRLALNRIYEHYQETSIPVYIEYIKKLSKKCPTPQTKWFLEHPYAGLENDDDDYD